MNRKIIKSILSKKLNQWVATIDNPVVQDLVRKNTIVTGGSIANMLLNEEVKDYDVYFKDKATTLAVANYYVDKFNAAKKTKVALVMDGAAVDKIKDADFELSDTDWKNLSEDRVKIYVKSRGVAVEDGKEDILNSPFEDAVEALSDADHVDEKVLDPEGKEPYRPVFLSSNAITLADKIQLIVRFYGSPEEIHANYDFTHCTNYYDYGTHELVLKVDALECLMNKELKYQGSRYPVCSMIRTRKFIKRGFHINAGQYLKMALQISKLDLSDVHVLEDQLIGVDSSYFAILINALKEKKDKNPHMAIDDSYVVSIIDKIF